jgi:hypothetical protein
VAERTPKGKATPVRAYPHPSNSRASIPTAELESFAAASPTQFDSASSAEGEKWRQDDHDYGGPQGEDGQVAGLPALERMKRAGSPQESGR